MKILAIFDEISGPLENQNFFFYQSRAEVWFLH